MRLSVIIPAHNEEDNIAAVIERVERSLGMPYELIVVDDHSQDETRNIVRALSGQNDNIKLVENKLDGGFANAIRTGLNNAQGDVVVPIMADHCDDLGTVQEMFDKINQGYDVVCASRYMRGGLRIGGSKAKGFFSSFVGRSLHYLLGLPTSDIANAFKMYRKKAIDNISIKSSGFEISMEMALKAYFLGFKMTEVPTVWRERTKGKSSFRMLKLTPSYFKLYLWAVLRSLAR